LLEILVVLAIIGMLAALAITNVDKIFGDSQGQAAQLAVKESMSAPLAAFRFATGDYPSTADGLQALITPPSNKSERWRGPYIQGSRIPRDPWGEDYQYAYPGRQNKTSYDLWSKGPDKISGNEDDIGNWESAAAAAR